MNSNKHLAYKIWLDELNTASSEIFFTTFRQILDLLIKESPTKIVAIKNKIALENKILSSSASSAVLELESVMNTIEVLLKRKKDVDLSQIEHYKRVKNGEYTIIGKDLPDTLYNAIRLTVEKHVNNGKLTKFNNKLLSKHDNFTYLDYVKMLDVYPSYKEFINIKATFEEKQKEEPWGAYSYLNWATTFFKNVLPEQAGSFVRPDIINNLRRFILYLLTPDDIGIKPNIKYKITYRPNREILLNESIRLAKPDFDSENEVVFEFLYKNPNKKITKKDLEKEVNRAIGKSFHKIVENLGFKGDLKRVFFQVSKSSIFFRNPVTKSILEDLEINTIKLP